VVDPTAGSKILVSSRISGLLQGSTEVKLALMTVSQSVEMLSHAAGLDSAELSTSLVEVAKICGRLPLCLNIAARMIADCGENWTDEVLPDMRAGNSWQSDNVEGASLQDSIIIASVKSIVGKEQITSLLVNAAVFGEDQRVPMKVFLPLYLAVSEPVELQAATIATIKRWLSVLIKRSLLLELVRGSIQLHDIVSSACLYGVLF
jgi:hypothetical protein